MGSLLTDPGLRVRRIEPPSLPTSGAALLIRRVEPGDGSRRTEPGLFIPVELWNRISFCWSFAD